MKKRKPPILLGAILLIIVGIVLAVNASSLPSSATPDSSVAQSDEADKPATEAPEPAQADESKVHQSILTPEAKPPAKGEPTAVVKKFNPLKEGEPLISAPRKYQDKGVKPAVSASGQWYRPESGAGKG